MCFLQRRRQDVWIFRIYRPTCVAVCVSTNAIVKPTPVGVEHNGGGLTRAAATGAVLRGEFGMVLSLLSADLLAVHCSEERESDEAGGAEHGGS